MDDIAEVMDQVLENVANLESIVAEIESLAESGGKYNEAPHVIEVTLPMLCSYLPFWWLQGPDQTETVEAGCESVLLAHPRACNVIATSTCCCFRSETR